MAETNRGACAAGAVVGVAVARFGLAVGVGRAVDVGVGVNATVGVRVGAVAARLVGVSRPFEGVRAVGDGVG